MSGKALKAQAKALAVVAGSHHATIQKLILDGFFDNPISSEAVARRVTEKSGYRLKTIHVQTYLKKFLTADILQAVKPAGSKHNYWVLASVSRAEALRLIGKGKKLRELQQELFSPGPRTGNSRCRRLGELPAPSAPRAKSSSR